MEKTYAAASDHRDRRCDPGTCVSVSDYKFIGISQQLLRGRMPPLWRRGLAEYDPALPEGELPYVLDPDLVYHEASMKFSVQSVVTMAVIVLLALAATYWATGKMLRPLKELTESVQMVDDRNLDKRVELKRTQGGGGRTGRRI